MNQDEVALVLVAVPKDDYGEPFCSGCYFKPILHGEFCKAPIGQFPCTNDKRMDGRRIIWKLKDEA